MSMTTTTTALTPGVGRRETLYVARGRFYRRLERLRNGLSIPRRELWFVWRKRSKDD